METSGRTCCRVLNGLRLWEMLLKNNIPSHVGFIPDGNRRWAVDHDLPKEAGYAHGINPGLLVFDRCKEYGIEEVSIYCFTQDNVKRPSIQTQAFSNACVTFALEVARRGAALLVVGDETSTQFPEVLKAFRHRQRIGMKMNLLVNYGWEWDLAGLNNGGLPSDEVSRLDLIVRWGGGRFGVHTFRLVNDKGHARFVKFNWKPLLGGRIRRGNVLN